MILKNNQAKRIERKVRIKKVIRGNPEKPRLSVYRSLKHIYVQVIDDTTGRTIVSASTLSKDLQALAKDAGNRIAVCKLVGKTAAEKALEKNIKEVVFDRNGFLYHGQIKAVADGAREAGLKF